MSTELRRLKDSHAQLSEQVKEARRVIALYQRWEQAADIECDNPDSDIDSASMLIEQWLITSLDCFHCSP